MRSYTLIETKFIEDINSNVTIYKHNKTKARICTIENDDNNKVFSIAFRTPPINNGGLTHILEHSVLCGSKKYPVKDPFVELIKGSLNTFLNAFTFPDKTMYPCASKNDKDFKNLMSVYMDAVFYPQIYKHEEIFMQEGWHYHILDENEPITYNGVVYNEMKGAFSDPQQVLYRDIMHSLYPDTPYGLESGGDPRYIPELDYKEFLEFHSKFYHPTNSYIFLYGDCDMKERMEWLDSEYLSNFDMIDFDTRLPYQEAFLSAKAVTNYYPLDSNQSLDNKTFLSYNLALNTTLDTKKMIATNILIEVLLNNPGAPLKQALIDARLGEDVFSIFDDGLLQPFLSIIVLNSSIDKEEEFINLVNKKLNEILENGLDYDALLSLIQYFEFKVREGKFGSMPKGLEYQMTCLGSWLYDENQPFNKLENLCYYEELKKDIYYGYFEDIIRNDILNNNHKTYVKLVPSHTIAKERDERLEAKLLDYKNSLSKEELKSLIAKNKALQIYQSTPSTKEEIETLPRLELSDLGTLPERFECEELNEKYRVLSSNYHTNGINYVNYTFDISDVNIQDLQYVKLISDLMIYLSTNNKSFIEINQIIQKNTGGISTNVGSYKSRRNEDKVYFNISFSAMDEFMHITGELIDELVHLTNFKDEKRLFERLSEIKVAQEMGLSNRGHIISLIRASSYFDYEMKIRDNILGLGYADFIADVYKEFNVDKNSVIMKIENIYNKIFAKDNFILRFTGNDELFCKNREIFDNFYDNLIEKSIKNKGEFIPEKLNEGFQTQSNVNFVARTGRYKMPFNGAMNVLNNALSLDYLWMQVRVHGGAYGCMLNISEMGIIGFTSYRDPHIKRTNDVYEDVVNYINDMNPSEDDLLKYKIGAIGSMDPVLHNSLKGSKAQIDYLLGNSYELRAKYRKETLEAKVSDLKDLAVCFKEALSEKCLCVVGNSAEVLENKELFINIRNLNK